MSSKTDNQQQSDLYDFLTRISRQQNDVPTDLKASESIKDQQYKFKRQALITECYNLYKLSMEDNRSSRRLFGLWTIALLTIMFFIIMGVSIYVGVNKEVHSDAVIITLLCTSTANLIGLVAIIFRCLFSNHDKDFLSAHASNLIDDDL